MEKWKLLLASRKFWAAIVGLVLMSVKAWYPDFPLEEEPLTGIITVLVAYILGTAVEDGLSKSQDPRLNPHAPEGAGVLRKTQAKK